MGGPQITGGGGWGDLLGRQGVESLRRRGGGGGGGGGLVSRRPLPNFPGGYEYKITVSFSSVPTERHTKQNNTKTK